MSSASLEFAQKLLQAKAPEEVMKLHADYVKAQMQALTEQARDIAQHAGQGCHAARQGLIRPAGRPSHRGQPWHSYGFFVQCNIYIALQYSGIILACSRVAEDQRVWCDR